MLVPHCCPVNLDIKANYCLLLKQLGVLSDHRDMNWEHQAGVRRKPIHGGSSPASMRVETPAWYSQFIFSELTGHECLYI